MLKNFFTSNEFATFVVLVAAASLVLLFLKGMVVETIVGAIVLVIALGLIFFGGRQKDADRD